MADETQEQFREKARKLAEQVRDADTDGFRDEQKQATLKASAAEVIESYKATA